MQELNYDTPDTATFTVIFRKPPPGHSGPVTATDVYHALYTLGNLPVRVEDIRLEPSRG